MKLIYAIAIVFNLLFLNFTKAQTPNDNGYIIESEANIAKIEPSPHKGEGSSVGYNFFNEIKDFKTAFKKRVLKPNSSIGYHQQKKDEIYYIVSGKGKMTLNNAIYEVKPGDAILTRTGASHNLKNTGNKDLALIIVYEK